eukprot:3563977-Heterocapsa_arctica.AAC.1
MDAAMAAEEEEAVMVWEQAGEEDDDEVITWSSCEGKENFNIWTPRSSCSTSTSSGQYQIFVTTLEGNAISLNVQKYDTVELSLIHI